MVCSPADTKNKFDEVVDEKGVRILIEPNALMHVLGTTMDYVEDRIKCVQFCAPYSLALVIFGHPGGSQLLAWAVPACLSAGSCIFFGQWCLHSQIAARFTSREELLGSMF